MRAERGEVRAAEVARPRMVMWMRCGSRVAGSEKRVYVNGREGWQKGQLSSVLGPWVR